VPDLTPADWDEMFKDEPGPPTAWDEYYVELLVEFQWLARHPSKAISDLGASVYTFCRNDKRLSSGVWLAVKSDDVLERRAADDLMRAMMRCYAAAVVCCPTDVDRQSVVEGFRAMQALVLVWAETPAQRRQRPKQDLWIMSDCVQILKLELRKQELRRGIVDMTHERRKEHNDAVVTDLKRMAGAA
jgi:hypothetical protein